jgi:hypothetical protein
MAMSSLSSTRARTRPMSEPPRQEHRGSTAFRPLEATDFRTLKLAPSLKGLLKPFTGKGELHAWAQDCVRLRDGLIDLAQRRVLTPATTYPFSILPAQLTRQPSGAGTVFLRWRNVDRSAMGVGLWAALMANPRVPPALLPDLHRLEHQRITLNMQISLMHILARHATACADQMERADEIFFARRSTPTA